MACTCRFVSTARKRKTFSAAYRTAVIGTAVAEGWSSINRTKPNGALCRVREQIIEDAPSGLTLQFECEDGRLRLVIAGSALPVGNREILFDSEGREAAAGTLVGEFRRPSWLKIV
jgi:hypothetical protein